ncbi:MAG: beta-galactosidase [Thiolinea sp.]
MQQITTEHTATRTLGVCYYPEHWPQAIWEEDARRMVAAGLTWVRIGEFADHVWNLLPVNTVLEWLDEAIRILGAAGLKVVLGTPTATPPRWMLDLYPDLLALDAEGRPRKFGSRRHYCFSHAGYRTHCARIVEQLAQRYGRNPMSPPGELIMNTAVTTPRCHTVRRHGRLSASGCGAAILGRGSGDIAALNTAWGNVFWSMEYQHFEQIDLPNLTVTGPILPMCWISAASVRAGGHLQSPADRHHQSSFCSAGCT